MAAKKVPKALLNRRLPVLFVHIGWAQHYDGTEPIKGNFAWLRENPTDNGEAEAFTRNSRGLFRCGIGPGITVHDRLHVVFVARDPVDSQMKAVGLYAAARVEPKEQATDWPRASTKHAILFPVGKRPVIKSWPTGRQLRRWAWRDGLGREHPQLLNSWRRLCRIAASGHQDMRPDVVDGTDTELSAVEGQQRRYLIAHRLREEALRRQKIRATIRANNGRLVCEVPGCGFEFSEKYGALGVGYAQVHHLRPLSRARSRGRRVTASELAVVCANCHAMIHRGGQCRPLKGLIP